MLCDLDAKQYSVAREGWGIESRQTHGTTCVRISVAAK